jgi:hypothetical protein
MLRRILPLSAFASALALAACLPVSEGLDFAIRADDGWAGLPIDELLLRPSLNPRLLAACFEPSCPEPTALLSFSASGKDARDLKASFDNPEALAELINKSDREDKSKARKAITTRASAEKLRIAGFPAFRMSLSRADKPERDLHGIAVANMDEGSMAVVIAIAAKQEVALANAESAASELLR